MVLVQLAQIKSLVHSNRPIMVWLEDNVSAELPSLFECHDFLTCAAGSLTELDEMMFSWCVVWTLQLCLK